jgi:cytosine/adenosine deaminase-related metal-dependent hydrolase
MEGDDRLRDRMIAADGRGRVLIKGAAIVSMDPTIGDLARGDILLEGDKIEAVGEDLSDADNGEALVLEAEGSVAIPGLQDAHRHSWQTQMRRALPDATLLEYVEMMHGGIGPSYRPEDMYLGNRLAALTALDQGITTVLDISHNRRTHEHLTEALRAWQDSGIRSVFVPTQPMLGDWDGQWREDMRRLREGELASDDGLVTLRLGCNAGVHPEIVVGDLKLSSDTAAFARQLEIGLSCDAVFGELAAQHMLELARDGGVLGPDVTLIHCQSIGAEAWRAIADAGCRVVLASTSDAQLRCEEGVPPIQDALDVGITPALSVDVECCLSSDLFTQMQVTLNVQRMHAAQREHRGEAEVPEPISVRQALECATIAGAAANGVDRVSGSLTPGKQADIVLIGAEDLNNMPLNDAVATVVLGADSSNVDKVFVAGRPRKWGSVLGVDLGALRAEVTASRDFLLASLAELKAQ